MSIVFLRFFKNKLFNMFFTALVLTFTFNCTIIKMLSVVNGTIFYTAHQGRTERFMSEELKNDLTPDLYTLVDEDGKEQTFEMLDAIEHNEQTYFALIPYNPDPNALLEDDGEFVILKTECVDGEDMLVSIDDDEEFLEISEIFMKRLEVMFEEDDDDECDCGCGHCH